MIFRSKNREAAQDDEAETTPLVTTTHSNRPRSYTNITINRAKTAAHETQSFPSRINYQRPKSLNFDRDSFTDSSNTSKTKSLAAPQTWTSAAKKVIDGWADRGQKPTTRQQLAFHVDTSRFGRFWDLFDFVVNLLLVCIYLWNTQFVKEENREQLLPTEYFLIEWFLAVLLFAQWIPRVYIAPDMFDYLASGFSLVSMAATAPPIIVPLIDYLSSSIDYSNTYMATGPFVYIYPLRFLRLHLSFTTLLLPVKNSLFDLSVLKKKTLQLCSTILFNIFFVSAWIHIVTYKLHETDEKVKYISFFDSFFFTTISSTSGFNSNLVPDSVVNRVLILYIMISGALFLPGKISELLALLNKSSPFDRSFVLERNQQHVIVCGNFDNNCLFEFLREFFCEDHGLQTMNTNVVIINYEEPSEELKFILNDPTYLNRVQYVKGIPTSNKSLQKASAQKAKACFILTNKLTSMTESEIDANAVMLALAIKRFCKTMKIYAKVNMPENKPHFDQIAHQIICLQELRMKLLAQNIINPGFSTLITLLATSITKDTCNEISLSTNSESDLEWLDEYMHGASHEIYYIQFSKTFTGMKFISVAQHIYQYFGVTLFAINVPLSDATPNSKNRNIILNPPSYTIKGGETGYIISSSAYDAYRISTLGQEGNNFDEYSCIFNDMDVLSKPESPTEELEIEKSDHPSELKEPSKIESDTKEPVDKLNNLVLLPDENPDEGNSNEVSVHSEVSEIPLRISVSSELASNNPMESLTVQERNVNQVISDMIHDNSYFDALTNISKISGHIVICDYSSSFTSSIEFLVGSLRASHIQEQLSIVLLSVSAPSDNQLYVLENFGDVHFLQGSPLSRKSLFSAGVSRARKAIVLCDGGVTESDEKTADASTLLVVLNLESMALDPDFSVVVEFIHRENMKLLGVGETISASETYAQALLRPAFMAGHAIVPCMLEPLICQAYYNRDFLAVINLLVFDSSFDKWRKAGGCGEGGAPTPSRNGDAYDLGVSKSHVFTCDVPTDFIGRPFFHLFNWLLSEKQAIPLGLYRTRAFKGKLMSYVITNPKSDGFLIALDKVYIISETML